MSTEPIVYTRDEVLSFLPLGWVLPPDEEGRATDKGDWTVEVLDLADQSWELTVRADEAAAEGRIEALRQAFRRLHREALGRAGLFG